MAGWRPCSAVLVRLALSPDFIRPEHPVEMIRSRFAGWPDPLDRVLATLTDDNLARRLGLNLYLLELKTLKAIAAYRHRNGLPVTPTG
ncbi:hypothetical protein MBOT_16350 [Mycobacterium botniense]|uniref:Uncharacterized protein n=1 Tax=Mycobacterium botniense TaxID=84962 RepID=A0A7I9XWW0_9MYCO|nr:hypothetical protein MBOT_16350 [Mycobacterium botniense]